MLSDFLSKNIRNFCHKMLNVNIKIEPIFELFNKVFIASIILTIIIILFTAIYYIKIKKYSLREFYLEYRKNIFQLIILYIINIFCLYFLNDLLTENINKFEYLFNKDTIQESLKLLLFTLVVIILFVRQLSEIISFLCTIIIQPIFMFQKDKIQKLQQENYNLIINTILLNFYYIIFTNVKLNSLVLTILLLCCLNTKIPNFFYKKDNDFI